MNEHRVEKRAASLVCYMGLKDYLSSRSVIHRLLCEDESESLGRELTESEKDAVQAILSHEALAARS